MKNSIVYVPILNAWLTVLFEIERNGTTFFGCRMYEKLEEPVRQPEETEQAEEETKLPGFTPQLNEAVELIYIEAVMVTAIVTPKPEDLTEGLLQGTRELLTILKPALKDILVADEPGKIKEATFEEIFEAVLGQNSPFTDVPEESPTKAQKKPASEPKPKKGPKPSNSVEANH